MKIFLLIMGLLAFTAQAQTVLANYYVTVKGDTVALNNWDYIDIHSHPQLLWTKGPGKKKKVVLPDSVVYLQREYTTGIFKKTSTLFRYILLDIKTRNNRTCRHYAREVYSHKNVAVMETPYCNDCRALELYLAVDGQFNAILHQGNFTVLANQHFSAVPEIMNYARKKKYKPWRFYSVLKKIYRSRD